MNSKCLKREFYTRSTLLVAKELLGKYLVRKIGNPEGPRPHVEGGVYGAGKKIIGKIVETEAYIGPKDKASHAYQGKITKRNKTEYLEGGHIYIYLCYGIYWQLNITTEKSGKPECVLIRALEPVVTNKSEFTTNIPNKDSRKFAQKFAKIRELANGPGKLCRWMKLDKSFDGEDLTKSNRIWLEDRGGKILLSQIAKTKRIGIDYAEEWAKKPWRFYIKNSSFVSRN